MAARIVELCDALVDFLNTEAFSQTFTAARYNVWYEDLADTDDLQVVVIPQDSETTEATRGALVRKYRVNVVVQQRLVTDVSDDLMLLAEELEDALYMQPQAGFGWDAFNENVGSRQFIDVDAAAGKRLFRVVLQVSYLGA